MKARIVYRNGKWWCFRMGVTGCGATPAEAWSDMWALYGEAIRSMVPRPYGRVRQG